MGKAHYLIGLECYWEGQPQQGIEHGRLAVPLLDQSGEHYWLAQTNRVVGLNLGLMGEFELALEAETRAYAMGEALGDPRLQCYAAWSTGWIYATRGDWEAGIEACQQGLKGATSPHNTTLALGYLGHAYLEKGDVAQAIPLLEQAVLQLGQFQQRRVQSWFTIILGEAYLWNGHVEKARALASQGLEMTRDTKHRYGIGWAHRALGRIARAGGAFSEAEHHLHEALQTFTSIHARFEVGRTHLDLAALAHAQGNQQAAASHFQQAHSLFKALRVPTYVERVERLAQEFGLPLSEASVL